jgi:hypothetical protein
MLAEAIGISVSSSRHYNAVRCPQEFIRFLNTIDAEVPAGKVAHVIRDNYADHKHPNERRWLGSTATTASHSTSRLRRVSCSTPSKASSKLTKRRLKRGVFVSVVDLQAAVNRFVAEHTKIRPFTWTADPDKIIRAVRRGHQMLDSSRH